MPIVLFRVDDRLIHGQVTVAWGAWLSPDRIVLANDGVATSAWKREMYAAGDTMGTAVEVMGVEEFGRAVAAGDFDEAHAIAVLETPSDLLRAVEAGAVVEEANIGGMHHSPGKRELLPYVYVGDEDVKALRTLADRGVKLEARDVPQARSVDIVAELDRLDSDGSDGGSR